VSDAVILYDADCGFCRTAVARVLAWDRAGRLRSVPLQSTEADRLLPGLAPDEKMASWHLVIGGQVHSGGAAAAPLLRLLPGGRPLASVLAALPGMTDRAYRLVARNRDGVGRLVGARCAVPARRDGEGRA
jgi:predicted DCC family thiol-disulfide oxidoreductase YuxK